ncbi:hypothetical protein Y032_0009g407 [Ancylostoma ceylanicum]|uniref:Uncharacterized protein n=1 Tax=Ancylostoma ceylanicum TaxID=53326 RepID=A0A016VJE6_9BILA|nr:hypothetical protein Y032_0009g407 [Ancylostoma ceylanicum]
MSWKSVSWNYGFLRRNLNSQDILRTDFIGTWQVVEKCPCGHFPANFSGKRRSNIRKKDEIHNATLWGEL